MHHLEIPASIAQQLVDGLMGGYKDYLAERKQKQQSLTISGAFAWTRSNFIDSKISELVSKEPSISSQPDKAGYAWEYIQFIHEQSNHRSLIIVKNARQLKRRFNNTNTTVDKNNYLYQLAGINNELSAAGLLSNRQTNGVIQLELALPGTNNAVESLMNQTAQKSSPFSKFYIVTYAVDNDSKMIKHIELTMPNQTEMTLKPIQDLTPLIKQSPFQISLEEVEPIQSDQVPDAAYEQNTLFGYEINADPETEMEADAE